MMAASAETSGGDQTVDVELIVLGNSKSAADGGSTASASDEITPLLTQSERPKVNIFSVSHSRRKPREQVIKVPETDISSISQWVWNGSRYSGLVCMALSSTIYFVMEVLSNNFTVQSIPLLETAFTRCTVSLILSYLWLRRSGQPIFGATYPRNLLVLRALVGYVSLLSFIYCIQRIPLSQGIVLNFTTPIMASIMARIILHEKLKIAEMGGLACSFFGVLFIFQQMLTTQGTENGNLKLRKQAVLIGLFSSITGGISYCLIKAAAKASDQPVLTVFSFGILASPAAAICTFAFEEFVLPSFYSLSLMIALGILSFLAEVFLTRGLQLEKISKVENVQFIEEEVVGSLSYSWSY
ncbi:hypothetical protein DITRI_Ditri11bG0039700 [Diplodiscus trichospermus]